MKVYYNHMLEIIWAISADQPYSDDRLRNHWLREHVKHALGRYCDEMLFSDFHKNLKKKQLDYRSFKNFLESSRTSPQELRSQESDTSEMERILSIFSIPVTARYHALVEACCGFESGFIPEAAPQGTIHQKKLYYFEKLLKVFSYYSELVYISRVYTTPSSARAKVFEAFYKHSTRKQITFESENEEIVSILSIVKLDVMAERIVEYVRRH